MTDQELIAEARKLSHWDKHRFLVLVAMSIIIALLLVAVALKLYHSSGAAQLDLSRPGYETVTDKVNRSEVFAAFPSSGDIDKKALADFREIYQKRAKEATNVESFGGDVMSDKSLGIDAPVTDPSNE